MVRVWQGLSVGLYAASNIPDSWFFDLSCYGFWSHPITGTLPIQGPWCRAMTLSLSSWFPGQVPWSQGSLTVVYTDLPSFRGIIAREYRRETIFVLIGLDRGRPGTCCGCEILGQTDKNHLATVANHILTAACSAFRACHVFTNSFWMRFSRTNILICVWNRS